MARTVLRPTPPRRGTLLGVAAILLLLGPGVAVASPSGATMPTPFPPAPGHVPAKILAAPHPPGLRLATAPGPHAVSEVWYTQEGATLAELNGSSTITGLKSLSLRIPLVRSPYPIGYELNGLSDVGDWYQIVIGDNWPGCSGGFAELTETWFSNGVGNAPVCDTTVALSAGDLVELGINYTGSHNVCLDLLDVTTAVRHDICGAPPDSGGRSFVLLSSKSDGNGYFTGPMTEIANTSATACPDYTSMPLVNYEWPSGIWVTAYTPWSDEFELNYGTLCYNGGGFTTRLTGADLATSYTDTASGTSYGPHWVAGQNYSLVNALFGWRLQTDPVPVDIPSVNPPSATIVVGANVTLTAAASGGVAPYQFRWYVDGSSVNVTAAQLDYRPAIAGPHRVAVYAVDARLDVGGPSPAATVTVNGPLAVGTTTVSTTSGAADVGEPFLIQAHPVGGLPPLSFSWTGLPGGCASANLSTLPCTPNVAGNFSTVVMVQDTNGSIVASPVLPVRIWPALGASLASPPAALDQGQTLNVSVGARGGAPPYTYAWAGLPGGCAAPAAGDLTCLPAASGNFTIRVNLSDANGASVPLAAPTLTVHPRPTVGLRADRAALDVNMSANLTASPTLGAGGGTFVWGGLPVTCPADGPATIACRFPSAGFFNVTVVWTDQVGGQATSPPLEIRVAATPRLAFETSLVSAIPNGALYLNATLVGGAPGVVYTWDGLPPGCGAPAGPRLLCLPTGEGVFNVTLTATDGAGGVAVAHATIEVAYPVSGGSGAGANPPLYLFAGLAVAVAAVIAAAFVLNRRRSRGPDGP